MIHAQLIQINWKKHPNIQSKQINKEIYREMDRIFIVVPLNFIFTLIERYLHNKYVCTCMLVLVLLVLLLLFLLFFFLTWKLITYMIVGKRQCICTMYQQYIFIGAVDFNILVPWIHYCCCGCWCLENGIYSGIAYDYGYIFDLQTNRWRGRPKKRPILLCYNDLAWIDFFGRFIFLFRNKRTVNTNKFLIGKNMRMWNCSSVCTIDLCWTMSFAYK